MAKDKKKKKDKKTGAAAAGKVAKAGKGLKVIAQNPLVADVVAAALVGMAAALKDSNKARQLASNASDELTKMSAAGAKRGGVLWDMALQIGRESLEAFSSDAAPKRAKSKPAAARKGAKKAAPRRKPD